MPSIGLSFFILGLAVASVTANETSAVTTSNEFGSNNYSTAVTLLNTNFNVTISVTTTSNVTWGNSTISPLTTTQKVIHQSEGGENSANANTSQSPPPMMTSPKPIEPSKSTSTIKTNDKTTTDKPAGTSAGDSTGIIILVMIILVAVVFGVACYFARKRGRRYSVDFTSRPDEANIPLSAVEPELPIGAAPQNGLQTFESTETTTKEPEATPEVQEEQKAEPDKPVADPSAESAAPVASPDISEDKPTQDVVEPTPPAPVKPSVEEKTDDEGIVSNKTSVESLKETNENNSNNADISQMSDSKRSNFFWDVPLDCPV